MIKWNEYTWYSKWASLVFFLLILPATAFYVGAEYKELKLIDNGVSEGQYEVSTSSIVKGITDGPLGGLDEYGNPKSGYYSDDVGVYFVEGVVSSEIDSFELLPGALELMHGFISYAYAKDKWNVYYNGKILYDARVDTFKPIENGRGTHYYGTDGTNVFFEDQTIVNADPKTFEILWETMYEGCGYTMYSKDESNVYYENVRVPGADAATYEALIKGYGKDKRGFYKGLEYIGPTLDERELFCEYG